MKKEEVLIAPLVTEKGQAGQEAYNQYGFRVAKWANKNEIKAAVEKLGKGLTVTQVRTMVMPGRYKRVGANFGRLPGWKKAVVTLKQGDKLELFEGV